MRKLILVMMFICALSMGAQTTYPIVTPDICGAKQPTLSCVLSLSPANALGIYPTITFVNVSLVPSTAGTALDQGAIYFANLADPSTGEYYGTAEAFYVVSPADNPNKVIISFLGIYAGGRGTFIGSVTLTLGSELVRINRWTTKTVTIVESGSVTID